MLLRAIVAQVPGRRELLRWRGTRRESCEFAGSAEYWQRRYLRGGNSGSGSYGALAEFKASVLNRFVEQYRLKSVIDFGCGDGHQLSLAEYPSYIGFDVAREAIRFCKTRFAADPTKSFFLYDPECFVDRTECFRAEVAISCDVLFHLVEDPVFEAHLKHLFQCATRFVVIYSSDCDLITHSPHERHRRFSDYVSKTFLEWQLLEKIENPYPLAKYPPPLGSLADFYVYRRAAEGSETKASSVA